jgi:branched-chain amino acid transport system permease protein
VLGALIIEPAQQYLTTTISNDYLSEILLGALFLAVILLLPRGVIPTGSELISKWRSRRRGEGGKPPGADAAASVPAGTVAAGTGAASAERKGSPR